MKAKYTPIVGFTKTISMAEARAMYPSEPAVVAQADPKHADIYAALRAAGLSLVKTAHGLHVTELIEGEASTVYPQLGAATSDAALNDAYAEGRKDEREANEWRPIATAPRLKGQRVLLLRDGGGGPFPAIGYALDGVPGWNSNECRGLETLEDLGYRVTHWMPLPAAPKATGEQQ